MPDHEPLSPDQLARSRKYESLLLQRVAEVGLKQLADVVGVDQSTVSRMKWNDFSRILAFLGLKIVPVEMECYSADYIKSLHTLAQIGMTLPPDSVPETRSLNWDA